MTLAFRNSHELTRLVAGSFDGVRVEEAGLDGAEPRGKQNLVNLRVTQAFVFDRDGGNLIEGALPDAGEGRGGDGDGPIFEHGPEERFSPGCASERHVEMGLAALSGVDISG